MLLATQDEENYECLCKLLTTIGQKLDENLKDGEAHAQALLKQNKQPKWVPEPHYMDNVFKKLRELSVSKALSSRIQFALLVSSSDISKLQLKYYKSCLHDFIRIFLFTVGRL